MQITGFIFPDILPDFSDITEAFPPQVSSISFLFLLKVAEMPCE